MSRRKILTSIILVSCVCKAGTAAQWDNAAGVGFNFGYVDNISLAPEGDEESQYVTQITPFISLHGEGGRARLDLDYRLQYIKYQADKYDDEIFHQLFSDANVEFLEDFLFLDLRATTFQSAITADASIPQDNVSITDNRTNVTTASLSPYINTRILSIADLVLRYTYENTDYDDSATVQPDTVNKSYIAELSSQSRGDQTAPLDWSLRYYRNELDTDLYETNYYQESSVTLFYNITAQFIPFTTVGDETNKIVNTTFEEGGSFWSAGIIWQPTTLTSITGAYGERFYGPTKELAWETRGRTTTLNINYSEEITNVGQVFARQPSGEEIPPGADNEFVPIDFRPYIRKRLETNIQYSYSKTTVNWYAFNEKRLYLTDNEEEKSYGSSLNWTWRITDRTTPNISTGWQRIDSEFPTQTRDELINIDLGVTHITSNRLVSSLTFRHVNQNSDLAQNEYEQNSINLNVTYQLENN